MSLPHNHTVAAVLQNRKKNFLTDLHSCLTLSLALSVFAEDLGFAFFFFFFLQFFLFAFSLLQSFSPLHYLCPLLLSFFFIFSDFSSLLFIPLFESKSFVSLFKSKGFEHIVHIYVLCVQFFFSKRTMC